MDPQVLLVASSAEGNIAAWDLATTTQLTSYKGNASPVNGLSLLGRDYLVAAQRSKGALHVWAWHKDQVHQRSFAAEPLTAVAASPGGLYCAAGGASGAVYVWEVSSGRLLRSWPAHYKSVTALAFDDTGAVLVSGGEDTLVAAWLVAEVLDCSGGGAGGGGLAAAAALGGGGALQPLHSWSDHTLAITGLAVGAGGANAVVASASLDRCVKLRSLGGGGLLLALALPAAVHSVALDPGEHALYAGSASGAIYEVSLVGADPSEDGHGGGGRAGGAAPAAAAAVAAAGSSGEVRWRAMEGHSRPVTCLGFTGDAAYLVSGSEDQSVRVWDLRSRQQVRLLLNPAKGPVSGLLLVDRPPFMQVGGSHAASASSQATSTKKGPKRPQPLAPFAKYANAPGPLRPWEGGLVLIDGSAAGLVADGPTEGGAVVAATAAGAAAGQAGGATGAAGTGGGMEAAGAAAAGGGAQQDLESLREENERLKQQLARALQSAQQWVQVNSSLQQMCGELLAGR